MIALLPTLSYPTATLLIASLAAAAALVYLPFLVVAYGRLQSGYDAAAPRAMFDKLPAYAQRATWAHQNAFEALALFTAAVVMSFIAQPASPLVAWAAIAFVIARVLYPLFYILNLPVPRSLMFAVGSFSIATIMTLSVMQALS